MLTHLIREIGRILSFLAVQYTLGRRGSFPYGLLMKFSLEKLSLLVVFSDLLQTLTLLHFFDACVGKWRWLRNLRRKLTHSEEERSLRNRLKRAGNWGLVVVSALPYGGGALTGSILAVSLHIDKRKAFAAIMSGCVIGTLLWYLVFAGILTVFT